jgi:hypothetical protein
MLEEETAMANTNGAAPSSNGVFPELVIELEPSTTRQGAATLSPLGQTVSNTLREVLAWRPKSGDAKGFVAALNQAFTITEMDGHTEFAWTPRSYAVQADMGAVTGAQASIFARAKAALDQSVPLLEGLFPIRADADDEDAEATRALVVDEFTELVQELGQVGGPRLARVEGLFDALLGAEFDDDDDDPEEVGGLLGIMQERFGLERLRVNTVDEEQNLTNFLIVVDHIIALQSSWDNLNHFFDRNGEDVFLGTQLVLISRALNVVVESVQELYFILDSVFLGAAERQVALLDSGLTIAELLSWVERFASEEAPRVIREAGKDGVVALRTTVVNLLALVTAAQGQAGRDKDNLQAGFNSRRSQVAWEELRTHIEELQQLTSRVSRVAAPRLLFVSPNPAPANANTRLTIYGENLAANAVVYFKEIGEGLSGREITSPDPSVLYATVDLSNRAGATLTLVVRQGVNTTELTEKLIVANNFGSGVGHPTSPPIVPPAVSPPAELKVETIADNHGARGEAMSIRITGSGFGQDAVVKFAGSIEVVDHVFVAGNGTQLRCDIQIAVDAPPGPIDVIVTSGERTQRLAGGFTVDEGEAVSRQAVRRK